MDLSNAKAGDTVILSNGKCECRATVVHSTPKFLVLEENAFLAFKATFRRSTGAIFRFMRTPYRIVSVANQRGRGPQGEKHDPGNQQVDG